MLHHLWPAEGRAMRLYTRQKGLAPANESGPVDSWSVEVPIQANESHSTKEIDVWNYWGDSTKMTERVTGEKWKLNQQLRVFSLQKQPVGTKMMYFHSYTLVVYKSSTGSYVFGEISWPEC